MQRSIWLLISSFFVYSVAAAVYSVHLLPIVVPVILLVGGIVGLIAGCFRLYDEGFGAGRRDGYQSGYSAGEISERCRASREDLEMIKRTGHGKPVPLRMIPQGKWTVCSHEDADNDLIALLRAGDNNPLGEFRLVKATGFDVEVLKVCDIVDIRVEVDGGVRIRPAGRKRR